MHQAKKRNIMLVGLALMVILLLWIYVTQPLLTVERLSVLKSVYGEQAEVKRTYLFKIPNYLKALGYSETGHLYASKELEVNLPEELKDKDVLFTSFYGFEHNEGQYENYQKEFETFHGEEKTIELNGISLRIKSTSKGDSLESKIAFTKGKGWYFLRTESLVPMEKALYEEILKFLLQKTLS